MQAGSVSMCVLPVCVCVCVCYLFENMLCQHLDIEHGHAARSLSIVPLHSDVDADTPWERERERGREGAWLEGSSIASILGQTLPTGYHKLPLLQLQVCY